MDKNPPELCQHCQGKELINISAKHSDSFSCHYTNNTSRLDHEGYGFDRLPWNGEQCFGDYLCFTLCITCGRIQGCFPLTLSVIKASLHSYSSPS